MSAMAKVNYAAVAPEKKPFSDIIFSRMDVKKLPSLIDFERGRHRLNFTTSLGKSGLFVWIIKALLDIIRT